MNCWGSGFRTCQNLPTKRRLTFVIQEFRLDRPNLKQFSSIWLSRPNPNFLLTNSDWIELAECSIFPRNNQIEPAQSCFFFQQLGFSRLIPGFSSQFWNIPDQHATFFTSSDRAGTILFFFLIFFFLSFFFHPPFRIEPAESEKFVRAKMCPNLVPLASWPLFCSLPHRPAAAAAPKPDWARAGRFKSPFTAEIILIFRRKYFFFFLFSICVSLWSESRSTQPRRGCVDRSKPSYLVLEKEGGGERCTINSRTVTAGSWYCWLEHVIRTSMNTRIINSIISKIKQMIFTPSTAKWVARAPQGPVRVKKLRADSRGTPTARGRQCKTSKKDKRRKRGEGSDEKGRQCTNQS